MSNYWSRKGFCALAACVVASFGLAAGAGATALTASGIKPPTTWSDVATVGYYDYDPAYYWYYDQYYGGSSYYDYSGYYDGCYRSRSRYNRGCYSRSYYDNGGNGDYDDDNGYYEDDYYSEYSDYFWRDYYKPQPTRYYGTRAPREAYERDEFWTWLPPSKPSSCGEFHYWNGHACVDARHFKPYIGPKW